MTERKGSLKRSGYKRKDRRRNVFLAGLRDGIPIGLGYFAVSFSLGIYARTLGLNAWQGFFLSLTNLSSTGEFAAFGGMAAAATLFEIAVLTLVANARYLLMGAALSQRLAPEVTMPQRLLLAQCVTDEIFGITIARPEGPDPLYSYGALAFACPMWAIGTAVGIAAGSVLPDSVVSALSIAIYGMLIAVFVPPCKKDLAMLITVVVSCAVSALTQVIPVISAMSSGLRLILLTIVISVIAALIHPVRDENKDDSGEKEGGTA